MKTLFASLVAVSVWLRFRPTLKLNGQSQGLRQGRAGSALPGVTVTATGPQILAPVVGVTDDAGYYRLLNLPPGTVALTAELAGFAPYRREGILMRAGSTFSIDVEMKVGTLQETVTVGPSRR